MALQLKEQQQFSDLLVCVLMPHTIAQLFIISTTNRFFPQSWSPNDAIQICPQKIEYKIKLVGFV